MNQCLNNRRWGLTAATTQSDFDFFLGPQGFAVIHDGQALWAKKEVKVTLGGCGG